MIKKESINAVGETWRGDTISVINSSDIICIFGASLGKSDSDYWELIASWLKSNSERQLFIYEYAPEFNNRVSIYNYSIRKDAVIGRFLSFSDFDEATKKKIEPRIHVIINAKNTFVIPENYKVKHPTPPKTTKGNSLTIYEAFEAQQRLADHVLKDNRIAEQATKASQLIEKLEMPLMKTIGEIGR